MKMLRFSKKANTEKEAEDKLIEQRKGQALTEQQSSEKSAPMKKKGFSLPFGKKKDVRPTTIPDDLERFRPATSDGLSSAQVGKRMEQGYQNISRSVSEKSVLKIIWTNVFTFFNMLLLAIAIALIVFGRFTSTYFLLVAIFNTIIGIVQEIKAKNTIDKLRLVTSQSVRVRRDRKTYTIPTDELVLDDIYYLSNGDQIPTDSIVLEGTIEVNESLLTGESLPIKKEVGDKIFAGSFVVSGSCTVQAEEIGDYNYASGIQAKAKEYSKPKSELLRSLNLLIKVISIIIVPLGIGTFCTQWLQAAQSGNFATNWEIASEAMRYTAGSVVGMIPSGMYLLTSVALAAGVINLAKKKTLVQDLYCIEMLARVNVLCLDKTGTLTDGTMKVDEVLVVDSSVELYKLMGSYLNAFKESNQTSIALSQRYPLRNDYKVKNSIPFSSARKFSAVSLYDMGAFVLGAPEYVYTKNRDRTIVKYISDKQASGYRVVMLCRCERDIENNDIKGRMFPVAIFTLEDHIRPEAPDTIKWFTENGVQIKIISGDNPLTASEIAKKCNVPNAEKCVSLEGLSLREVAEIVDQYTVFGRVSPEQKAAIVKELKNRKNSVGMTGDGVNDILAMKNSDCSIAMANGASAARNAAHLVLLDSNFASMPAVVEEGRRVINNIQRSSSLFLMKTIFTIAFTVIVLLTFLNGGHGIKYPFETNNIMVMEIVGIGVPSFFLALQKNKQLITGHFLRNTFSRAIPAALILIMAIGLNYILYIQAEDFLEPVKGIEEKSFVTFCSLTMSVISLAMVFNCCSPFNLYRSCLYVGVIVLFCIMVFVLPYIPAVSDNPESSNLSIQLTGIDFRDMSKTMWLMLVIYGTISTGILNVLLKLFAFLLNKPILLKPTEEKDNKSEDQEGKRDTLTMPAIKAQQEEETTDIKPTN